VKSPWAKQASLVVLVTIVLDQLTKWWAVDGLFPDTVEVLPTLEFDLTYNTGMSFSTGSDLGVFIGIGVIAVSGFLNNNIIGEQRRTRALLMASILGGAVGNLLDRLFRGDGKPLTGPVVDFIDVSWWAVFNVADIFVVCGVIGFALYEWLYADQDETPDAGTDDVHAADSPVPVDNEGASLGD
jgi:signal peptidase II